MSRKLTVSRFSRQRRHVRCCRGGRSGRREAANRYPGDADGAGSDTGVLTPLTSGAMGATPAPSPAVAGPSATSCATDRASTSTTLS